MAEEENLFEAKEGQSLNEAVPLVNEPYTYDNMVNNPIIKPISETDRSLRDLDEMVYKKLIDVKKFKEKINVAITDVAAYQDCTFISDLIKLAQSMDDVIKLQDIQMANLKDCIKKVEEIVRVRYGVRVGEKEQYEEPVTIFPEGGIIAYLDKLSSGSNELTAEIAKNIKEVFLKMEKGRDEKEKFDNAGIEVYSQEKDKVRRQIIAKIIRMEI